MIPTTAITKEQKYLKIFNQPINEINQILLLINHLFSSSSSSFSCFLLHHHHHHLVLVNQQISKFVCLLLVFSPPCFTHTHNNMKTRVKETHRTNHHRHLLTAAEARTDIPNLFFFVSSALPQHLTPPVHNKTL